MKKVTLILAGTFLLALSFTSCKKDWTCSCDDGSGGTIDFEIKNTAKAAAKTSCEGKAVGITTGCKLK